MPYLGPAVQERLLWKGFEIIFDSLRRSMAVEEGQNGSFEAAWEALFGQSHLRLSFDTFDVTGMCAGDEVRWLIYDVSLDASEFHCFPSRTELDARLTAELDDLQGARDAFVEGRSMEWLEQI